jgi:hypothetical protein
VADYVERMVEGLARVLARAVAHRRAGRLAEAQAELAEAAARIAGVDLGLVDLLGPAAIAAHLDDRFRLEALAGLCRERAELEVARGEEAAADRWRAHADAFAARIPAGIRR